MDQSSTILPEYVHNLAGANILVWRYDENPRISVGDEFIEAKSGDVKIRVGHFQPGTNYPYACRADKGIWSDLERLHTAVRAATLGSILIGESAWTSIGRAPFPSLLTSASLPLEVFCHFGDMSDNDG